MIHPARPIVTPEANIAFCCFVFQDLKSGDGRTDGQHVRKQLSLPAVTLGWPSESISKSVDYHIACSCYKYISVEIWQTIWI